MRIIPILISCMLFLTSLFMAMVLQLPLFGLMLLGSSLFVLWLEVNRLERQKTKQEHYVH